MPARVPRWISVPVTVVAALAVTQWLARGMTSPLREMTAAARRMAGGDYGQRVTATSSDEVGDLARAFNAMAADLASADTQRRQLVATVSHELRTPLTAQRALLENLVDGVVRPDDDALRGALHQSERLSALVTDLLDLSRIDAGVAPLSVTEVRVADLLARRRGRGLGRRPARAGAARGAPGRPHRARRPGAPGPARREPRRQRGAAQPARGRGARHRVAPPTRRPGGSRCATRAPASPPTGSSASSTGSARGTTPAGAPAWAWPSRAGSASCTAAGSAALPTADGTTGAVLRAVLPLRPPDRPTDPPHGGAHHGPDPDHPRPATASVPPPRHPPPPRTPRPRRPAAPVVRRARR